MRTTETAIEAQIDANPQDWRNLLGILADVRREEGYDESADDLNAFLQSGLEIQCLEEIEYGVNWWKCWICDSRGAQWNKVQWSKKPSVAILRLIF